MDANGQKFWILTNEKDWDLDSSTDVEYKKDRRQIGLVSRRKNDVVQTRNAIELSIAQSRLAVVPATLDEFGTYAFWDVTEKCVCIIKNSSARKVFVPLSTATPTDMCLSNDGVLYVAISGRVFMHDLRCRWRSVVVENENVYAGRLSPNPEGGVWVLDTINSKIGRVDGLPLSMPPGPYAPDIFRPCEENDNPPRLSLVSGAEFHGLESPVDISCNAQGSVLCLCWNETGDSSVRKLSLKSKNIGELLAAKFLKNIPYPYSLAWTDERHFGVLIANLKEALVYEYSSLSQLLPQGDLYPLTEHDNGPFVHNLNKIPHYGTFCPELEPLHKPKQSRALRRLSLPSFISSGLIHNQKIIDSGEAKTEWHRLYIEAVIPDQCGIEVRLAATEDPVLPDIGDDQYWHTHSFGELPFSDYAFNDSKTAVKGLWTPFSSEVPHHNGLLHCAIEKNISGLFTALIQRNGKRVRTLRGRYLWVQVVLKGNGRSSPELAALRAYGNRFSYVNHYLPELYHETLFGPEQDDNGAATPADFMSRFLANIEGVMTPISDRVTESYLLTDPRTVPEEALDWLASWVGLQFDSALPKERYRDFLEIATRLYRWHGTLRGLKAALEVATGGGLSGGEIIVLEDFRLRRTIATIIGAELSLIDDPLLVGVVESGNSYVGDTLFLGNEHKREFLAVFGSQWQADTDTEKAIEELFSSLAFRATVLVHQKVNPQDMGLIQRIVEMESPAHVETKVISVSRPFMVGMSALVGVDSYLNEKPVRPPVKVNRSNIGVRDFIHTPAAFDTYYGQQVNSEQRPVAIIDGADPEYGDSFTLDSSRSTAFGNRQIVRRIWEMLK